MKDYLFIGIAIFLYHQSIISAISPVTEKLIQSYADCAAAAASKDECAAKGCSYDCIKKKCLPKQYERMTSIASSPCFHHCADEAACTATSGCTADNGFCLAHDDKYNYSSIAARASFETEYWEFTDDCQVQCTPLSLLDCLPGIATVTLAEMCSRSEHMDHQCCESLRPTFSGRAITNAKPAPTKPTTTKPTTTVPTTTKPTTTTPKPDPVDQECHKKTKEHCKKDEKCAYDCTARICVEKERIREECSQGCSQYCHDPCGCKAAAGGTCEYNVFKGECFHRPPKCPDDWFVGKECGRKDHFYVFGGALCLNTEEDRGGCKVLENVLSVNANGRKHRDRRGIDHRAENEVPFEDQFNGRKKFYFSHSRLKDMDRYLFESLVSAMGHGTDKRQCLRYKIPLSKEGDYELTIETYEPFANRLKRRMFNIELHDNVVVPNLDIFAVVGKDVPMSIVVNFNVTNNPIDKTSKFIFIKGHAQKLFKDSVKLGFCVGDCRLEEKRFFWEIGNYAVSAFSVLKVT